MTTINDAYMNALLADSAYVGQLLPGETGDNLAAKLKSRMTDTLARYIGDNFSVVTQIESNAVSGSSFDATVWKRNSDNKLFISVRGTQQTMDFLVDGDLALNGAARDQIADMVNWWLKITTANGEPVPQIQRLFPPVPDANGQLQYFRFIAPTSGTGQLVGASNIEVNGHSLGGHLATAFARILGGSTAISHITAFNSAGFTASSEAIFQNLQNMLGMGTGAFPSAALQTNYFAKNGLNVTTNTFWFNQIGQRVEVFNEVGTGPVNHYMYKLTDALALFDAMGTIDSQLTLANATRILDASAANAPASLETMLDALRRLGRTTDPTPTQIGDAADNALTRADYHAKLNGLRGLVQEDALLRGQFVSLVDTAASDMVSLAFASIAYRYALKNLNPFAVIGNDALYAPHNANGALNLYNASASGTHQGSESNSF